MAPGGFNQVEGPRFWGCKPPYLPLGSRPDVLVFQTASLPQDLEVTGPIEVLLWVASSARDTDFTAKLIDGYPPSNWYPPGYALNITDSILRLRYRGEGKKAQPYTPARWSRSPSPSNPPATSSLPAIAFAWTCPAPTSRALTSIPIPASPWALSADEPLPTAPFSTTPFAPRISCCR